MWDRELALLVRRANEIVLAEAERRLQLTRDYRKKQDQRNAAREECEVQEALKAQCVAVVFQNLKVSQGTFSTTKAESSV